MSQAEAKPNIDADTIEQVISRALLEHGYEYTELDAVEIALSEAEVYEALNEYIWREINKPSLKGPGSSWTS